MPSSKKRGDAPPKKKKIALKEPKPRKKRAPRKKGQSSGKRGELDLKSQRLGEEVRKRIKLDEPLPKFEATKGIRKTGLDSLRSGDTLKAAKQFNDSFRRLGPNMDEFFSTATMREFAKGLLGVSKWSDLKKEEQEYLNGLIDILSAIRAPTEFVGFTLDTDKLQHPTSREAALFEDPYLTASRHALLDRGRRDYVQAAGDVAVARGESALGIVTSAAKAAIEFTLNTMAAPISASNIQPNSRLSKLEATDPKVLEQVKWREYLKDFYEEVLGGELRKADPKETRKASLKRTWQPPSDTTLFAPPSPRRYDDEDEEEEQQQQQQAKGHSDKIELDDILAPQPDPWPDQLEDLGQNAFSQDISSASEGFHFDPPSSEYGTYSTTTSSSEFTFDTPQYGDGDIELSDLSSFPYSAPTSSSDFKPVDYGSNFNFNWETGRFEFGASDHGSGIGYQSDDPSPLWSSSPSQEFSQASDAPSLFAPSSPYSSFGQGAPYQFGGYGQSQFGQGQFGEGQFGQSSTSFSGQNPFSSSLSGEALGEESVAETLVDLVLL